MDIYKDSLFLQSGTLGEHTPSFSLEFEDGSVFFLLSEDEELINYAKDAIGGYKHGGYSLIHIIKSIALNNVHSFKNSGMFFVLANSDGYVESVSHKMPPIILKNKKDEISLVDCNRNIFDTESAGDFLKLSSEDVGVIIFANSRRVINELKDRCFSIFAKCELERVIGSLSKRVDDLDIAYFILNNTLRDRVKFAFNEKLPAKLKNIINYETELEKVLRDSYPNEDLMNDNALTIFNELILNAHEHGTLGIESDTKQQKMLDGTYEEYITKLEEENDGFIDVELVIYEQNLLKITIKDKGKGFDFSQYDCKQKEISLDLFHGRGIQMSNLMSSLLYYENNGSRVTFFIKYGQKDGVHEYHHDEEMMLKDMSVLYVEDDHFIRMQFSKIIQRMVKKLYVASDGEEGLELYNMEHPDIVLTDIEMPKMNGLDMSEKIKEVNPDQPILIMTAYNQDEKFLRAIDIGVDKYVIKPVKISQLKNSMLHTAKQLFYKKEAMRLLKEKERIDMTMLSDLQAKNRYAVAQQTAAFEKQKLIIHDDSGMYDGKYACKVFYKPLERLSGDIYGVFKIDEENTFLYVVDSMGKGLAASVTAVLSAAYINRAVSISISKGNFSFEKILCDYQEYIGGYLLDDECLSFSMIHIDLKKRVFRHGTFGMYPILLKDCETFEIAEYRCNNAPYMKFFPVSASSISEEIRLPETFGLFVFSDGLVETELFGMKELLFHLKEGQEDEEIDLFKKVMDKNFITDDDLTLIHFSVICRE